MNQKHERPPVVAPADDLINQSDLSETEFATTARQAAMKNSAEPNRLYSLFTCCPWITQSRGPIIYLSYDELCGSEWRAVQ